jgi:hypothetical protein
MFSYIHGHQPYILLVDIYIAKVHVRTCAYICLSPSTEDVFFVTQYLYIYLARNNPKIEKL